METQTEIIAKACFTLFNKFIEEMCDQAKNNGFTDPVSGVHEIGPKFAFGGVSFEASHLPLDDVRIGAVFRIVGINLDDTPVFRLSTAWSRSWR